MKLVKKLLTAYLSVSAVLAPAFSTDEHVSLRAAHFGELMLSNGLLGQRFPDLFQLCACHLLPNTQFTQTCFTSCREAVVY